jgi:hypothetical protein
MPSQFAVPKQEGIHPCKASAVLSQHCNTIYSVQYRSEARYSRRHKESTCFHSVERALYGSSIPFHYRSIPVYYGVECDPRRSVHVQSVPFRSLLPCHAPVLCPVQFSHAKEQQQQRQRAGSQRGRWFSRGKRTTPSSVRAARPHH